MHIDVFILPVRSERRDEYLAMARWFNEAMIDFGALEIMECWESDIPEGKRTDFRKAVMAEDGECILVSWLIWPDKKTAEAAHDAIHEDERFKAMTDIPFDGRRMVLGSFEPILHLKNKQN